MLALSLLEIKSFLKNDNEDNFKTMQIYYSYRLKQYVCY